jgi:hypothetical protein
MRAFQEGDWVRHQSCPQPVRVIGAGPTIAVEFPNGAMRAFEPSELKKVSIFKISPPKLAAPALRRERQLGSVTHFGFFASALGLIYIVVLLLAVVAGVR